MGITKDTLNRLERHGCLNSGLNMLELGAQNLYDTEHYGWIAKDYFESIGIIHKSIDIIVHQKCEYGDLRDIWTYSNKFDVITNAGTCEHIDGDLYQPMLNIHNACKIGGVMVHENPMHLNWPGHGYHYFTEQFYYELGYEVLEVTQEAAMGNTADGWNICAVLRKNSDKFLTQQGFDKLYNETIFKS